MSSTVVVTGAGDSVGRKIAERFAAQGAQVFICDISQENLDRTVASAQGIEGMVTDIGDLPRAKNFFRTALDRFGAIDVLVNTVGIGGPQALTEDIDLKDWKAAFSANLHGMLIGMQSVIPSMKKRKSGCIINFSSASTKTGMIGRSTYISVKSAVEGLTRNAARELGPHGVRCNAILPGVIDNERMRGIFSRVAERDGVTATEVEARYLDYVSTRSKISPHELADVVLFLSSDAARNITGQMISVDGNLEWEM